MSSYTPTDDAQSVTIFVHVLQSQLPPQSAEHMSKMANREASPWDDFKAKILACNKTRDLSDIYGTVPSTPARDQASKPTSSFAIVLRKSGVHTSTRCRIKLPSEFCKTHKVERHVTMADSTELRLWHMRFQSSSQNKSIIGNGWREFAYDHSLKLGDRLVFTLLSSSHFLVEFALSKGSMLPIKAYPWRANYSRLNCLESPEIHKTSNGCKNVQDGEKYANSRSFSKRLTLESGTHTARLCRLVLPREFCENHKVQRHVTMTDSTRRRLWHMRMQLCGYAASSGRRVFCIGNGWREFLFDHGLKRSDTLVFTLLSTSHFLVTWVVPCSGTTASGGAMFPPRECESNEEEVEIQDVRKKIIYKSPVESDKLENGDPERTFTRVLPKYGIHTARCCRLHLPRELCEKHKVERHVTMTDSEGHRTWHMRLQSSGFEGRAKFYCISNGWREFSYDHGLEADGRLVFTLLSASHFRVEFADSARAMVPTKDGRNYPWNLRQDVRSKLLSVGVNQKRKVTQQKVPKGIQNFCESNSSTYAKRKEYVLPELTHLECKNADGTSYLQIVDSDSDSEMMTQGEE